MTDLVTRLKAVLEFDEAKVTESANIRTDGLIGDTKPSGVKSLIRNLQVEAVKWDAHKRRPIDLALVRIVAEACEIKRSVEMAEITNGIARSSFRSQHMLDALADLAKAIEESEKI